jgi:DUF1365 family protein
VVNECKGPRPALYTGIVHHRRLHPRAHSFSYPINFAFLDIDRIPELCGISPLLSHNRLNWASFHDADHLGDPSLPLRERLRIDAARQGVELPTGPVFLLALLRYAGYCFNPVSYFYCYDEEGNLARICAEVCNTPWNERHTYWMDPTIQHVGQGGRSFDVVKAFHVSPFMAMDCRYRWAFTDPGDSLKVHIAEYGHDVFFFDADLELMRQDWNGFVLLKSLIRFPLQTLGVIVAIHWEAFRLWIKRVPVYTHPKKSGPGNPEA